MHKKDNELDIKECVELVKKYPEILKLQYQCREIRGGKRYMISQKVIDDAFDAFEIIVKKFSSDPEERLKLQKFLAKDFLCEFIRSANIKITT